MLAAFSRLGYNLVLETGDHNVLYGDEHNYNDIAWNLVSGRGYSMDGVTPTAYRPPTVPMIIAGIYTLVGSRLYLAVRILFSIIDVLTVILSFFLCRDLFGWRAAILTGFAMALHPYLIMSTSKLLTETTLAFLLVLTAYCIHRLPNGRFVIWGTLAGVSLGLAILARSETIILLGFVVLYLFHRFYRGRGDLLKSITAITLGMLFVLLPWAYRNMAVFGEFIPLSTSGGLAFYGAHNMQELLSDPGNWNYFPPSKGEIDGLSEVSTDKKLYLLGISSLFDYLRPRPWRLIRLEIMKLYFMFIGYGDWRSLVSVPLVFFAFLGLTWSISQRKIDVCFPFVATILTVTIIFYGSIRFRLPYDPFFVILASNGAINYFLVLRRNWQKSGIRSTV